MSEKVQADFMVRLRPVLKEVFDDVEQFSALNDFANFFPQFAHDRRRRVFAGFDTAARQGPDGVAFESMEQDGGLLKEDRRSAKVETVVSCVEGNHERKPWRWPAKNCGAELIDVRNRLSRDQDAPLKEGSACMVKDEAASQENLLDFRESGAETSSIM